MRPTTLLSCSILLVTACRTKDPDLDTANPSGTCTWYADADADGYGDPDAPATGTCGEDPEGYVDNDLDCDDHDATINPDGVELCNGLDDDCDGSADEDAEDAETFLLDADGDGYGDPAGTVVACEAPDGFVDADAGEDCDDDDPETHPDAPERCDGVDNDCDGEVDEELQELWYADADGDGWGNADSTLDSCDPGAGWVTGAGDCDDSDSTVHPEAEEVCNGVDDDCDGDIDEELDTPWYQDADGDGFGDPEVEIMSCDPGTGWVENAEDCDDANSSIHPDTQEICDALDNDCDGLVDDQDDSVTGLITWYLDADGDGFGADGSTAEACELPSGYAEYGGDCDDGDAAYNPGASEVDCTDPADYNCDGSTGYADDDGDGWAACEDCDDSDAAISPDAEELCNNVDDDCDGDIDEDDASDAITWYLDADGDGYGDSATTTAACDQPTGYVGSAYATDCDDGDASISPVDPELCDGVDNDCDGSTDEGLLGTYHADTDADGYGDATSTTEACSAPSGYVEDDTDCDDGDSAVNPGASEICDEADNDCDGLVDDDDSAVGGTTTWYVDYDGDGFGGSLLSTSACEQPSGYVADATDCDDSEASAYPGGTEVCDGADNDCDGTTDEDDATDASTWYADADSDGHGDAGTAAVACDAPSGHVADATDCDDGDDAVNPDAQETCDGIDNDCDGATDDDDDDYVGAGTWYADSDGDGYGDATSTTTACSTPSGYVADATDCDDGDGAVNPGASEICDSVDNDCDGLVDDDDSSVTGTTTWYIDYDGDGYGGSRMSTSACVQPSSYVADPTDCDDSDASTYPGADELCDGADNDCDGSTDEDDAIDGATFHADSDGDGYGDATSTTTACSAPSGYVADATDCDDGDGAVNPGASEICDALDNDCDGLVDDDDDDLSGGSTWYIDADGDGYGGTSYTRDACAAPSGYVADATDCDDLTASTHPGADETCDGADDDCDGSVDEDEAIDAATWYLDADGDGYGDASATHDACAAPSGYVADATDCDDGDSSVSPGASEVCNGVDDDCDGDSDDGVMGSDATCAAGSCLEVLEDGSPTDSDWFWLEDSTGTAYEEYCDFGTVGGGWAYRAELEIENTTGTTVYDHQVEVVLDTATLVAAGKLEGDGADLRFFTHDGPLMEYWIETLTLDSTTTSVWVTVPTLQASTTTDFTLSYGNPATERRSFCWHYDSFDASSTAWYDTLYASSWGTPAWTWATTTGTLDTDSTNQDYFLQIQDGLVDFDEVVYVEVSAIEYDNDAVGPMIRDSGGSFISATASDDYDGVSHAGGQEAIVENSYVPTTYYQGSYLLVLGNITQVTSYVRIGLYWDGSELAYYLDGAEQGSVADALDVVGAGLVTYANSGSPGASFDYLWVGSRPLDFDPASVSSDGLAAVGSESAF